MTEPLPPLAVLAGGFATRLRPLTETVPKSLVEVAGEPFLAHQLRLFRAQGWRRVVLLTGHLGEQIEEFVGARDWGGLDIAFSRDGAEPRGTGGAVIAALPLLGEVFAVTYGDSWLEEDPRPAWRAFRASGLPALMVVLRNRGRWGGSNAVFDGRLVTRHEKTSQSQPMVEWIDWGLSFFQREAFSSFMAELKLDLSRVTGGLARESRLAGHEAATRFHEIGQPEGLAALEAHFHAKTS